MQPRTRRALRKALHAAEQVKRNYQFWQQTSRLAYDHPTIPAAHLGWTLLHWLIRKTHQSWPFRILKDFLFEIVGQSVGQFVAKLLPFAIAIYLAVEIGDDLGQTVAVVTATLYGLAVLLLGPPVWFMAEMQNDADEADRIVQAGQTDFSTLEAWIRVARDRLNDPSNPPLPSDFLNGFRQATAAVTQRIRRRPPLIAPSPPTQ